MEAKVIQILLDKYICKDISDDKTITCIKSGNMKKTKIYVGDNVLINLSSSTYVIMDICTRKNEVIRPPVANIDQMILCISTSNPSPDYILLDKQLVLCKQKNIKPVICVTKVDLDGSKEIIEYIERVYGKYYKILGISVKEGTCMNELMEVLKNNTSAFSGNSGTGKSSIVNYINSENEELKDIQEIGEISIKSKKGKHTTKEVRLFNIMPNTFILDTPGFSSYEIFDLSYKELKDYYEEFLKYTCKYDDCRHFNESADVCKIKELVNENKIDKGLYDRYIYIYNELVKKDSMKYK